MTTHYTAHYWTVKNCETNIKFTKLSSPIFLETFQIDLGAP